MLSAVALRAIEFDRIVSIVAGLAVTPTGRERLEAMTPLVEPARVGAAQAATTEGVRFLSLDPGDMDTPLHALAVPDADPATLKRPETAAQELADAIAAALEREHA